MSIKNIQESNTINLLNHHPLMRDSRLDVLGGGSYEGEHCNPVEACAFCSAPVVRACSEHLSRSIGCDGSIKDVLQCR